MISAYIAASRRSDRSLEARVESARRASEIHKKRTGRGFRITEQDVMNEEMYEEEEDDISARAFARGYALRNMYGGGADSRLSDFLSHQFYMGNIVQQQINERYAKTFPNAPQFPANSYPFNPTAPPPSAHQNSQPQTPFNNNNSIQSMYAPLQASQYASFQQQQTLPQQFAAANAQYQQSKQMQNMNIHHTQLKSGMISPGAQMPQSQDKSQQPILRLPLNMSPGMMQNPHFAGHHDMKKVSPATSGHGTPHPSPLPLTPTLDLGPLSASLPADVQQFLDPSYGFLDYSTMQTPMSFAPKSPVNNEKNGSQNQEPEQLRTPANSTKSIDEGSNAHPFSPDVFGNSSDMMEKHQDVAHDGGLQFSTDFFTGPGGMQSYEELNNFDPSLDWMQDWGHHQAQQQPAYMFP